MQRETANTQLESCRFSAARPLSEHSQCVTKYTHCGTATASQWRHRYKIRRQREREREEVVDNETTKCARSLGRTGEWEKKWWWTCSGFGAKMNHELYKCTHLCAWTCGCPSACACRM